MITITTNNIVEAMRDYRLGAKYICENMSKTACCLYDIGVIGARERDEIIQRVHLASYLSTQYPQRNFDVRFSVDITLVSNIGDMRFRSALGDMIEWGVVDPATVSLLKWQVREIYYKDALDCAHDYKLISDEEYNSKITQLRRECDEHEEV